MRSARALPSNITHAVEKRIGKAPLLGRYHSLPREVEHDFVLTGKVLGSGVNGSVHMAKRMSPLSTDEAFAVKHFDLTKMSRKAVAFLEAEVQVFLCLDHPHICRLVNVYQHPKSLSLVMECMTGGELFDRFVDHKRFPERQAAHAAHQMLVAVHYLHRHGIVHRDLKLENFVYDKKDGDLLKLIDFGLSKFRSRDAKMKTQCGTFEYMAPEVLFGEGTRPLYDSQCDLWSFGIIMFLLLSGSMPFKGTGGAVKQKHRKSELTLTNGNWDDISDDAIAFVRALLKRDPTVRLTAMQALDHRWIQSHRKPANAVLDSSILVAINEYCKAPKFRRLCLLAMAWLLQSNETERARE